MRASLLSSAIVLFPLAGCASSGSSDARIRELRGDHEREVAELRETLTEMQRQVHEAIERSVHECAHAAETLSEQIVRTESSREPRLEELHERVAHLQTHAAEVRRDVARLDKQLGGRRGELDRRLGELSGQLAKKLERASDSGKVRCAEVADHLTDRMDELSARLATLEEALASFADDLANLRINAWGDSRGRVESDEDECDASTRRTAKVATGSPLE